MLKRFILFLAIGCLAACTAPEVSPTPDIDAIVSGTVEAERRAFFTPVLQNPPDDASFANPADVVLEWDWARDLQENEFYDVRIWREGEPAFGITWTSEQQFVAGDYLSQQTAGEYLWSIAVVEGNEETRELINMIGEAPPERRFTIESTTLPTATPEPTAPPLTVETVINQAPDNFSVEIALHIDEAPTAISDIEFTDDGTLLALAIDGRIYSATDDNTDGIYENYQQILSEDLMFSWAVGMAVYEERIYLSDEGRIGYVEDTDEDGIYETYTILVDDLPGREYPLHSNNGILIYDDLLYIAVGSTTDTGPIRREYESSILTMELDGSNLSVFAEGFRNPYDLTMSPDGRLFTGDNSPDRLDQELTFLPPEELNYVRQGRHYGFPDIYGAGRALRDIDYETEDPVTEFITSTVTVGLVYYGADQFPERYQDGVFVGQFGGMTPARNVVFVPLEETDDGSYTGTYEPFINFKLGWQPTSLDVGPDGSLYVVEWTEGLILRVTYIGE
ncbi:MAG: PQQ-dependent sugar dehydrogenase [Chloroflexota bacterium]